MDTNLISGVVTPVSEAAVIAILGYVVVFIGLIILMFVIEIAGKIMANNNDNKLVIKDNSSSDELPIEVIMMAATTLMNDQNEGVRK